jgi:ankyrin repeat protein
VRVLLAHKADVNAKLSDGTTALMDASIEGNLNVVRGYRRAAQTLRKTI